MLTDFIDDTSVNKREMRTGEWLIRESTCCVSMRVAVKIPRRHVKAAAPPSEGGRQGIHGATRLADSLDWLTQSTPGKERFCPKK